MRPLKTRLTVGLLAFVIGASLDYYMRRPGSYPNCFGCSNARCVIVFAADHPIASLTHPVEVNEMLKDVRWLD